MPPAAPRTTRQGRGRQNPLPPPAAWPCTQRPAGGVQERVKMPLPTPPDDLSKLAQRIRSAHADCEASLQAGLNYALECGRYLIEAKSKVPYGEWIAWVRTECEMSEKLAQRYMRVATHWPKIADDADGTRVSHLSFRQVLELIARNCAGDRERATGAARPAAGSRGGSRLLEYRPQCTRAPRRKRGAPARRSRSTTPAMAARAQPSPHGA